jgi:2-dehydro-3-deoxyphosphogluconate aldolase/(4S)-4-hydroxy-2-oxoglutarate aldolase
MDLESQTMAILHEKIIVVIRTEQLGEAVPAAQAIARGGIRVLEIALTCPDAIGSIAQLVTDLPDTLVGAGTVLNAAQAIGAADAGVRFLVSPGFAPAVLQVSRERGVPYIPGALTPTEITTLIGLGLRTIKIFPIRALGPSHIKDLLGPFPDLRAVPTGGVTVDNARTYIEAGAVAVGVGGSVIASAGASRFEQTEDRSRRLLAELAK